MFRAASGSDPAGTVRSGGMVRARAGVLVTFRAGNRGAVCRIVRERRRHGYQQGESEYEDLGQAFAVFDRFIIRFPAIVTMPSAAARHGGDSTMKMLKDSPAATPEDPPGPAFFLRHSDRSYQIEYLEVFWRDNRCQSATHFSGPRSRSLVNRSVELFLLGHQMKTIMLNQEPGKGRTIIEKFEQSADVGFAVVVLTPDDLGADRASATAGQFLPRARQNVILELGYFIAGLGRNRVCAIKYGDVELPSDIIGVSYVDFDERGTWQSHVTRELAAAGYPVDLSKMTAEGN